MIYRFTLISDESDDFVREIQIDPDATFYDFHKAILQSVDYKDNQMTSFFICDEGWEKEKEITLEEMNADPEVDCWIMKDTLLSDLIEDEHQKVIYVFDYMTERSFFIEQTEIVTGKQIKGAKCTRSEGEPPAQEVNFEEYEIKLSANLDLDEYFYGDQDYDMEDLDCEGFEGLGEMSNPYDDDRY